MRATNPFQGRSIWKNVFQNDCCANDLEEAVFLIACEYSNRQVLRRRLGRK